MQNGRKMLEVSPVLALIILHLIRTLVNTACLNLCIEERNILACLLSMASTQDMDLALPPCFPSMQITTRFSCLLVMVRQVTYHLQSIRAAYPAMRTNSKACKQESGVDLLQPVCTIQIQPHPQRVACGRLGKLQSLFSIHLPTPNNQHGQQHRSGLAQNLGCLCMGKKLIQRRTVSGQNRPHLHMLGSTSSTSRSLRNTPCIHFPEVRKLFQPQHRHGVQIRQLRRNLPKIRKMIAGKGTNDLCHHLVCVIIWSFHDTVVCYPGTVRYPV